MVGLHAVHRRTNDVVVQRLEVTLKTTQDIGGIFGLQKAPVVAGTKPVPRRAELFRPVVQAPVERVGIQVVGQPLGLLDIRDRKKRVVGRLISNTGLVEATRQPIVAVEIDLQAERRRGGHAYVAQPKHLVDGI